MMCSKETRKHGINSDIFCIVEGTGSLLSFSPEQMQCVNKTLE